MLQEDVLVRECKKFNRLAQREVYEKYAPLMRGVCMRYIHDPAQVKDILQEGFIKVFSKIKQFKGQGSFEGWIRRIMVNTAISHCKKNRFYDKSTSIDDYDKDYLPPELQEEDKTNDGPNVDESSFGYDSAVNASLSADELLELLNSVPENYKVVFNLFYLEGYKHKEIAELLGFDEKTSRSRLSRARKILQQEVYKVCVGKLSLKKE